MSDVKMTEVKRKLHVKLHVNVFKCIPFPTGATGIKSDGLPSDGLPSDGLPSDGLLKISCHIDAFCALTKKREKKLVH
jgi:hypothetical protein